MLWVVAALLMALGIARTIADYRRRERNRRDNERWLRQWAERSKQIRESWRGGKWE